MVLCCLFLVSEFRLSVHIIFWFGFGCWVATFWEMTAHSVDHMFSLHFDSVMLVISRLVLRAGFGF